MVGWIRPVSLVNARVVTPGGIASSVRFGARVLSVGSAPHSGDVAIDVDGAFVLPGLVNAHDHLELNHFGRLKCRERYSNASEWIDDLRPRLRSDPSIRANMSYPLAARLFIGVLKNLLAGVTTVAHHNPRYREIDRVSPIRVVRRYGWAHSLALERAPAGARGEPGGDVGARCLATPNDVPFIVHAGEGVDPAARRELLAIETMGCLRPNTILVHGVATTGDYWMRMLERGSSLVWCPASNEFLLGQTAPVRAMLDAASGARAHLCLATDSRLTGSRDLLEELGAAVESGVSADELLPMVTTAPASMLKLPDAGRIDVGRAADLLVIPPAAAGPASALTRISRRDVRLVVLDGRPLIAAPGFEPVFAARRRVARRLVIDGVERQADSRLVRTIARCPILEAGVEV